MSKHIALLKSGAGKQGGLEKYTLRLAKAFAEKGCKVTLVTTGKPELPFASKALPCVSKLSFRKVAQFDHFCTEALKEVKPDIVFGMDRNSFQTHLRAGNGVHAAYLSHRAEQDGALKRLTFALNPLHRLLLQIEKKAFEHPGLQRLFANSHMVKDEILHHYQIEAQKISVVHNGVEWEEMQAEFDQWQAGKLQLARELKLDPTLFHFLFIGHNFKRKGLAPLLHGLAQLSEKNFHLSVVGTDKNRADFEQLAGALGLEKKITFLGSSTQVRRFYQLADALIIPSFYDPFANVTVEALAMGVFVVSSHTNGGHEVLTKDSGTKIETLADPESVASALALAMQHPKTVERAKKIRASVKELDFSRQLNQIVETCLI